MVPPIRFITAVKGRRSSSLCKRRKEEVHISALQEKER
jgi:hypothetical protein